MVGGDGDNSTLLSQLMDYQADGTCCLKQRAEIKAKYFA